MGHKKPAGMRGQYSGREITTLIKEQGRLLPFGALGYLEPNRVDIVDIDKEILSIWTLYLNDEITGRDYGDRSEALKMKRVRAAAANLMTEK